MILGCYRKDDAADSNRYVAGLVAVLSEYGDDVVERVADPRTGIAGRIKWLPSVAEVVIDCNSIAAKLAQDKANADFQVRKKLTRASFVPLAYHPNLFVPSDVRWYPAMVERAKKEKPEMSWYEYGRVCTDGVKRDGMWVYANWYYDLGGKVA